MPVALRHGDIELATVIKALLADLVERGLDFTGGLLVVIDGAKAVAAAVGSVFGGLALIQRCQVHKRRNVRGHLPAGQQGWVDRRVAQASTIPTPISVSRRRGGSPPNSTATTSMLPARSGKG